MSYLKLMKVMYHKSRQHHTKWGSSETTASQIRNKTRVFTLTILFIKVLEILPEQSGKGKKEKGI